jgi:hypothetical protein
MVVGGTAAGAGELVTDGDGIVDGDRGLSLILIEGAGKLGVLMELAYSCWANESPELPFV